MKKSFNQIFEDQTRLATKIPQADYLLAGAFPIIDQGQNQIAGYRNDSAGLFCELPAIIFGDHTRIIKYIDTPFFIGADGVKLLKPVAKYTDCKYLFYALNNLKIPNTGYNRHFKWLKQSSFFIPSLSEQKRIAERLDKVQELISKQKEQIAKLDSLIKSRFLDMFGDLFSNSYQWPKFLLKDLIIEMFIGPFGSDLKNENYVDQSEGYCVVYEQKHAIRKTLNCGFRYINKQKFEQLKRFLVQRGDFIVSCRGTIGEIYCLPENAPRGIIHSSLMKVRPNSDRVHAVYFEQVLEHIINKENKNGGVIKMAITAKELATKKVPLPPLFLQLEFVNFVKSVEQQKEVFSTRLSHLETLYKSLMQEYFG